MENMNNLRFLYISAEYYVENSIRVAIYKSHFKDVDELFHYVYDNIENDDNITYEEYIDILNHNIDICTLDGLCRALNNGKINTNRGYIMPVFLDGQERKNTENKEQETITDYITELDNVYSTLFDNISKQMKEHGNLIKVRDYYYKIDDNGCDLLVSSDNGKTFDKVEETHYGYCEIFNQIQKEIDNKNKENEIIDAILNLPCDKLTDFMRHIGKWGVIECVADFNDIAQLIFTADCEGYDIRVDIENGHDYYVYGKVDEKDDTYHIYGLLDEPEEFMTLLHMDELVKLVSSNQEYLSTLGLL